MADALISAPVAIAAGAISVSMIVDAFDRTVIIATHDLEFANEYCTRSILLSNGRVVADGPTASILGDDDLMEREDMDVPRWLAMQLKQSN